MSAQCYLIDLDKKSKVQQHKMKLYKGQVEEYKKQLDESEFERGKQAS